MKQIELEVDYNTVMFLRIKDFDAETESSVEIKPDNFDNLLQAMQLAKAAQDSGGEIRINVRV